MLLPDLLTGVYTETNRPDLIAETLQAVQASTQKMHGMDFWRKDLVPNMVTFPTSAYLQTIDLSQIPQYRKLKYLRKWDPNFANYEADPDSNLPPLYNNSLGLPINPDLALAFFDIIEADDIFDRQYRAAEKVDVAYEAGSSLYMKSSTSFAQAIAMWYAWPNLDSSLNGQNFNSWVAAIYPYCIIYDAASAILQKIGMTDAARKYDYVDPQGKRSGLVWEQVSIMLISETPTMGY